MTDAIAGTYSDLKFIRTRKVCQVVVEIPIEQADNFVRAFGTPNPHQEVWVALARLQAEPSILGDAPTTVNLPSAHPKSDGERAVIRAVMLCKDPEFQSWHDRSPPATESQCRAYILAMCDIQSRSELKDNVDARMKLYRLITRFESETGRMAERRT